MIALLVMAAGLVLLSAVLIRGIIVSRRASRWYVERVREAVDRTWEHLAESLGEDGNGNGNGNGNGEGNSHD